MNSDRIFNNAYKVLIALLLLLIAWYVKILLSYEYLGQDAGYYLKIAYDLSNGLSYYSDFNSVYTPLGMYIYSIPFYFNQNVNLLVFQIGVGLLYVINAFLFFKVSKWVNSDTKYRLFFTLLMLLMQFKLQGLHILLEPIVLFFILCALVMMFKGKEKNIYFFYSGVFVFLAFYTKQYGLFVVPSIVFFILYSSKNRKEYCEKTLLFFIGLLLPVVVLIVCYYSCFSIKELVFKLLGKTPENSPFIITAPNYTYKGLIYKLKQVTYMFPFIPLIALAFFKRTKLVWVVLLLFLCSLTQLYFAYYYHYFQLIVPFIILLILAIDVKIMRKTSVAVLLITGVFIGASFITVIKEDKKQKDKAAYQAQTAIALSKCLPTESEVYLHGVSQAYYFKNKYGSPNTQKIGYAFPNGLPITVLNSFLKKGQFIFAKQVDVNQEVKKYYSSVCTLKIRGQQVCLLQKK